MTAEAMASGRGNDAACYPLVPFSNRIANGRLVFDGQEFKLEPNWPGVRHPMHGDGWAQRRGTWRAATGSSAELVHEHDAREGLAVPLSGTASRSVSTRTGLDRASWRSRISKSRRRAGRARPASLLRARRRHRACLSRGRHVVWATTEVLPMERVAVPAEWDFARSRRVDDAGLDNCFEGWDGRAVIAWPRPRPAARAAGRPAVPPCRDLHPGEPAILLCRAREPRQRQGWPRPGLRRVLRLPAKSLSAFQPCEDPCLLSPPIPA